MIMMLFNNQFFNSLVYKFFTYELKTIWTKTRQIIRQFNQKSKSKQQPAAIPLKGAPPLFC